METHKSFGWNFKSKFKAKIGNTRHAGYQDKYRKKMNAIRKTNAEMVAYFKQHAFEHVEAFLKEKEVNVRVLCLPNYIKFLLTPT